MMRVLGSSFATPGSIGSQMRSKCPTSDEQYVLLEGPFQSDVVGESPQTSRRRSTSPKEAIYCVSVYSTGKNSG